MNYFFVGIGGIIGAVLRYLISMVAVNWGSPFPLATFIINIIGCFILGLYATYLSKLKNIPAFILTGFSTGVIGAFTTFSTFSYETFELVRHSMWGMAIIYLLSNLWGGLFSSLLGYYLGEKQHRKRITKSSMEAERNSL
ncbi:putative fluoride ion transporter CrcB 1 [Heyndrickxia sporothermodurans]|nr:putative fluoride ion transporter CrcB 1 [Heyndrickxia sporothermodurans]